MHLASSETRARAALPVAGRRHPPELLDVRAEEGAAAEHHLEAVIVGRIVAAGDHDAAVHVELGLGIIEHRRRPEADPDDVDAALGEAATSAASSTGELSRPSRPTATLVPPPRRTRVPKLRPIA